MRLALGPCQPFELEPKFKAALATAESAVVAAKRKVGTARDGVARVQATGEHAASAVAASEANLHTLEIRVRDLCGDATDIPAALEEAREAAEAAEEKKYMAKALDDLYQNFRVHADKKHACRMCKRDLATEDEAAQFYAEVDRVRAETPGKVHTRAGYLPGWEVLLL
jgi:hypothetical protein